MTSTRRETRRQDRRATILAVARDSFFAVGFAGTSMSTIAATLGGSKGTLWRHFPSKEALFDAVVEDVIGSFEREIAAAPAAGGDIRVALTEFCARVVETATSPLGIAVYRMISGEAGRVPEIGRIFYERGLLGARTIAARYLAGPIAAGLLREADPLVAGQVLIQLCLADCHQRRLFAVGDPPSPAAKRADVETAVDIFMRAYATPG